MMNQRISIHTAGLRRMAALLCGCAVLLAFCSTAAAADQPNGTWTFRTSNGAFHLRLEDISVTDEGVSVTIAGFNENGPAVYPGLFLDGKVWKADRTDSAEGGKYVFSFLNEEWGEMQPDAILLALREDGDFQRLFWTNPDPVYLLEKDDLKDIRPDADGKISPEWKKHLTGYEPAWRLALAYGLDNPNDLYIPASPVPKNIYVVTDPLCEIGIDQDGIYPVNRTGIVSPLSGWLREWTRNITEESGGEIRFVDDPDMADILLVVNVRYLFHGTYSGAVKADGYSCRAEWTMRSLTEPGKECSVSLISIPPESVSISGGGMFWEEPPALEGTPELKELVSTVMGWY